MYIPLYVKSNYTFLTSLVKINELIKDISHHPSIGIGKPEPLRENLSGLWSRRISNEHRFVYSFTEKTIYIIQLRYHY